jgi:hypothetical protein
MADDPLATFFADDYQLPLLNDSLSSFLDPFVRDGNPFDPPLFPDFAVEATFGDSFSASFAAPQGRHQRFPTSPSVLAAATTQELLQQVSHAQQHSLPISAGGRRF